MTFNYVATVDFKLPEQLMNQLRDIKTTSANHFATIPQQIFEFYSSGTELSFPITLYEGKNESNAKCIISKEQYDELTSRFDNILDYMGGNFSSFSLNRVPGILEEQVIFSLPDVLKDQVGAVTLFKTSTDGTGLKPHQDYRRKSSLWYMFEGEKGHETTWYATTDEHDDDLLYIRNIPNIKHLTEIYRTTLKKNQWYVFDHYLYHGVTSTPPAEVRRVLNIEFFDISAKDLYNIINAV